MRCLSWRMRFIVNRLTKDMTTHPLPPCLNAFCKIPLTNITYMLQFFRSPDPSDRIVRIAQDVYKRQPVYIVLAGIAGGMLYTLWLKDKLRKLQI